jgi:hypothetical protein
MYLPVKCVRSVQKKRAITLLFELIYSKTRKLSIGEKNHRSQTGSIPFFSRTRRKHTLFIDNWHDNFPYMNYVRREEHDSG